MFICFVDVSHLQFSYLLIEKDIYNRPIILCHLLTIHILTMVRASNSGPTMTPELPTSVKQLGITLDYKLTLTTPVDEVYKDYKGL